MQNAPRGEHSAILLTFIKLPFAIKIFVLSIFECSLKTSFTVSLLYILLLYISCSLQKIQEGWYEKLHDWNQALKAYESKMSNHMDDVNVTLGRMRCLEALAEW